MKRTKPASQRSRAGSESEHIPQAIIRWPFGFAFPAVIYPIGNSETENEAILRIVKKALAKGETHERGKRPSGET